jgi:hypothetical protein
MEVSIGLSGNKLGPSQGSRHSHFEASSFAHRPEKEGQTGPSTGEIKVRRKLLAECQPSRHWLSTR